MWNLLLGVVLASTCFIHIGYCASPPVYQNLTIAAIVLNSQSPTNTNSGRVELQAPNGVWGTVCTNDWSQADFNNNALAVCSMLGYRNGGTSIANTFGRGVGNYVIGNMSCPLNATSLYQCPQKFLKTCGQSGQTVQEWAVICNQDPQGTNNLTLTSLFVPSSVYMPNVKQLKTVYSYGNCTSLSTTSRIVGGDGPTTTNIGNGYVQVLYNGSWSFISATDWDQADAVVLCRELCYGSPSFPPLPNAIANSVPNQLNPNILLLGYECLGNETRLQGCRTRGNYSISTYGPFAGVQCAPFCPVDNKTVPDVNCSTGNFDIFFSIAAFHFQISASDILHYNSNFNASCFNITSNINGTRVIIPQSSDCQTLLMENSTHIIYTNEIRLVLNSGAAVIEALIDYKYKLVCSIPKNAVVSGRFEGYGVEKNATVYDSYNYSISMSMYDCCGFTSTSSSIGNMYLVEIGQLLNVAVQIDNYDNKTKVVISSCSASPVADPSAYVVPLSLINNKCPVASSVTMFSLENQRQGFQVQAFAFAGYSMVYLTCNVYVCLLGSNSTGCDRTCNTANFGRRKRSVDETPKEYLVQSRHFMVMNPAEYKMMQPLLQQLGAASGQGSQDTNTTTAPVTATIPIVSSETSRATGSIQEGADPNEKDTPTEGPRDSRPQEDPGLPTLAGLLSTSRATPGSIISVSTAAGVEPTTSASAESSIKNNPMIVPFTTSGPVTSSVPTTTSAPLSTSTTTSVPPTTTTTTVASFPDSTTSARPTTRTTTVKTVPVTTTVPKTTAVPTTSTVPTTTTVLTTPIPSTTTTVRTSTSVPNTSTTTRSLTTPTTSTRPVNLEESSTEAGQRKDSQASSKNSNATVIKQDNTNEVAAVEPRALSLTSERGSASVVSLDSCVRILVILFVPIFLNFV